MRGRARRARFVAASCVALLATAAASTADEVQARIDADLEAGRPVVVHVVVALCDNAHQGIVPVPAALGDGRDPRGNLYWGALYGVRTHLARSGWERLRVARPDEVAILERVVFRAEVKRRGREAPVYVVADAWDGAEIRAATERYLETAAGRGTERVRVDRPGEDAAELAAGGAAHLVAYVGHDGLMDFSLDAPAPPAAGAPARSAVVLACASERYFLPHLRAAGARPLLLTTGLMAPEAYTLDAAIRSWASGATGAATAEAAARAYDRYQRCGLGAARRLFRTSP